MEHDNQAAQANPSQAIVPEPYVISPVEDHRLC